MTRMLSIKGRTGLFDIPFFVLSENESLKIKVVTDEVRIGKYRLCVRHGNEEKVFTLKKDSKIELLPSWLNKNGDNLEFSLLFLNPTETEVIKNDYCIEPLKVENVHGEYTYTAIMQEFVKVQEDLNKRLLLAEEKLATFENEGVPILFD